MKGKNIRCWDDKDLDADEQGDKNKKKKLGSLRSAQYCSIPIRNWNEYKTASEGQTLFLEFIPFIINEFK